MRMFLAGGEGQITWLALFSTQTLASGLAGYEAVKSEGRPEANPMVPSEAGKTALHLASMRAELGGVPVECAKLRGQNTKVAKIPVPTCLHL